MPKGHLNEDHEQGGGQRDQELKLRCHEQGDRRRTKSCGVTETKEGVCLKERQPQSNDTGKAKKITMEKCPFHQATAIVGYLNESSFRGIMGIDASVY